MKSTAIERAVQKAGGQTSLAKAINVSQGLVWQWLKKDAAVTTKHFSAIERATGVTAQELLADELSRIAKQSKKPKRAKAA